MITLQSKTPETAHAIVPYPRALTYQGRNGTGKMKGLCFFRGQSRTIFVEPINSKGQVARCWLELPLEEVSNALDQLLAMSHPFPGEQYANPGLARRHCQAQEAVVGLLRQQGISPEAAPELAQQIQRILLRHFRPDLFTPNEGNPQS